MMRQKRKKETQKTQKKETFSVIFRTNVCSGNCRRFFQQCVSLTLTEDRAARAQMTKHSPSLQFPKDTKQTNGLFSIRVQQKVNLGSVLSSAGRASVGQSGGRGFDPCEKVCNSSLKEKRVILYF